MTTYLLQVGIQNSEYAFLKDNEYRLCLSKAFDDKYTVI